MTTKDGALVDPRVRRTRQLLHQALERLLQTREFEKISVQDIAAEATVNRATLYDHYPDKFALLECLVGSRFHEMLAKRGLQFEGGCTDGLKRIALAVCDYLVQMQGMNRARKLEPHMEMATLLVLRRLMLEGAKAHPPGSRMAVSAASWAMYGAARDWATSADRCPPEEISGPIVSLVEPILLAS